MKTLLLLDTETSGLDPAKDHLLEVGLVEWSVEHRTIIRAGSWVVRAPGNKAEHVNGIPPAALSLGRSREDVDDIVRAWSADADALVAHNAEFDRAWLPDLGKPWLCSCHDVEWPGAKLASGLERERERPGQSLVALCLAHGVGVGSAHRALTDCLLIARLLERCAELGHDIDAMLARAMRPKVRVVSLAPFEQKDTVKAAGFRWSPEQKVWWRNMPQEDVDALPFRARVAR